jgi:hypothetical protein
MESCISLSTLSGAQIVAYVGEHAISAITVDIIIQQENIQSEGLTVFVHSVPSLIDRKKGFRNICAAGLATTSGSNTNLTYTCQCNYGNCEYVFFSVTKNYVIGMICEIIFS